MSEFRMPEFRMPESRMREPYRTRWVGRVVLTLLTALVGCVFVGQAASAAEAPVPEDVAAYFATGLVPRLADLYGSGAGTNAAFDETTEVGTIHRLLAWTPDFLAGKKTDAPTQLTNTWVAPVTAKSGTVLGLAAVWINPGNGVVELADFSRGKALVDALGRAPKDTLLIDDSAKQAWFATDGKTLTPLVVGTSKATGPLTPAEYQKLLRANAAPTAPQQSATNPGLLIAGITLGAVVLLLAVFILLPGRKRRRTAPDSDVEDADAADAVSVDPAPVDPGEASPTPVKLKRSFEPDPEPSPSAPKPRKTTPRKPAPASPKATKSTATKTVVAEPVEKKRGTTKATSANKSSAKAPVMSTDAAKSSPKKAATNKKPPTSPSTAKE